MVPLWFWSWGLFSLRRYFGGGGLFYFWFTFFSYSENTRRFWRAEFRKYFFGILFRLVLWKKSLLPHSLCLFFSCSVFSTSRIDIVENFASDGVGIICLFSNSEAEYTEDTYAFLPLFFIIFYFLFRIIFFACRHSPSRAASSNTFRCIWRNLLSGVKSSWRKTLLSSEYFNFVVYKHSS